MEKKYEEGLETTEWKNERKKGGHERERGEEGRRGEGKMGEDRRRGKRLGAQNLYVFQY